MPRNNPKRPQHKPIKTYIKPDSLVPEAEPISVLSDLPSLLTREYDYDSMNPVEELKTFVAFSKAVVKRYEENLRLIDRYDEETQDILHKIELGNDMDCSNGYIMYRLLREVRRERRCAKSEVDLLKPVYEFLSSNKDLPDKLARLQGECRQMKDVISNRKYALRTDIVSER